MVHKDYNAGKLPAASAAAMKLLPGPGHGSSTLENQNIRPLLSFSKYFDFCHLFFYKPWVYFIRFVSLVSVVQRIAL